MTLLPRYADELVQAGDRLAAGRVATRRRARLTAVVAASAVVVVGVAAAATTLWDPQLGDDRRGHPVASASAPPADQLVHLGVLRREATDADHGEQVRYALSMFSPRDISGIRTGYVRLLGTHGDGLGDVLVPAAEALGKPDALCLFSRDPVDGGGVGCFATADVLDGRAFIAMSGPPSAAPDQNSPTIPGPKGSRFKRVPAPPMGPWTFMGLVPDGVAAVRLGSVTATVHDNFFTIREPDAARRVGWPTIEWLDGNGQPIAH